MARVPSGTLAVDQLQGWVAPYVRFIADHMALKDWRIAIEIDPDLRDSLATVEPVPNRQYAILRVGEDFLGAPGEDQRHGIVHELVHLHMEGCRRTVASLVGAVTGPMLDLLQRNHDDQIEGAVDRLADSISKGLPTPEGWRRTGRKANR